MNKMEPTKLPRNIIHPSAFLYFALLFFITKPLHAFEVSAHHSDASRLI